VVQVIEYLPSKCKALSSNPVLQKKKIHWTLSAPFCFPSHPFTDTFTASVFWLWWTVWLWMWEYEYLFETALNSFEYMPRSRIAELYSNSFFNCLKNHPNVSWSGCKFPPAIQTCSIFPHSYLFIYLF
jgi:hypothetical protein